MGIPLADLGWKQRDQASFFIQLLDKDVELERHPDIGTLNMPVPDELLRRRELVGLSHGGKYGLPHKSTHQPPNIRHNLYCATLVVR